MGIVQQFDGLIWSWAEMLGALRRRVALWPFTVYAAAQVLVLLLLAWFAYPPISYFMAPLLKWRFGEQVLHYPASFMVLRAEFGQIDILLSVVLGAFVAAAAVLIFAAHYGAAATTGEARRSGASRYWRALLIYAVVMIAAQLITAGAIGRWGYLADQSPSRFRMLRGATVAVVLAIQSLFIYALPYVVVTRRNVWAAIVGSFKLAVRNPVTTYLIVAVPTALELLPVWLAKQSGSIVVRFSPEFILGIMFLWVVIIWFMNYATIGASTRFFLHVTQDETAAASGPVGASR